MFGAEDLRNSDMKISQSSDGRYQKGAVEFKGICKSVYKQKFTGKK